MKKNLIVLLMCLFCVGMLQAQTVSLSGKVTDGANGEALPGVSVAVVGTTNGTITDIDGNYTLNVESDATIAISFIGYATQQVAVAGRSKIDIVLQPDLISLDEVVAVGYGVVKKRDITGSVGSVSAEKLLAAPITSLDAGLQGKIAGVAIQQTSGAPGQSMKIRIRGGSSINYSNNPLYVIDGFIGADITTINPSDIATIDILKDASATAVYGSRGANGVVLITTNSPEKGKFKITFETNHGVSKMVNKYEFLSPVDQMTLMNIQDVDGGKSPAFSDDIISAYANGTKKGTDWIDMITRNGVTRDYSLRATGGSDNLQYYISLNHLEEDGVVKNSFYKRTSVRSNITAKLNERIKLVFNTFGTHTDAQGNNAGSGGMNNPIGFAAVFPQLWEPYITEQNIGEYQSVDGSGTEKYAIGDIIDPNDYPNFDGTYQVGREAHPMQKIRQNQESYTDQIVSNLDLTFDLGHNLTFFMSNSGRYVGSFSGSRTLEDWIDVSRDNVTASQRFSRNIRLSHTDMLTYEKDFGRHHLKASAVYEYTKSTNRNLTGVIRNLNTLANEWNYLKNGEPSSLESNHFNPVMRSWMGRFNYGFADKYLVTASLRRDISNSFSEDKRIGTFPSAAIAWRASEEPFIQSLGWIHNLKVRAGYGETGNVAIDSHVIFPKFINPQNNLSYYPMFGDNLGYGVIPADPTDYYMSWETSTQTNVGIDLAVLEGKLSTTIDLYKKKTSDVILALSTPVHTGFESWTENTADIENKGIEIGVDWVIKNDGQLKWDANFTFTKNTNIVKDLGSGRDEIFIADEEPLGVWSLVGGNSKFIVKKGEAMGSLFGLKALGLWQEGEEAEAAKYNSHPGEVKYHDLDEDGVYSAADRQIIGNTQPDFTFSLGTSVAYKGFDLSVQCIGSVGNDIYNFADNILTQQARILSKDYLNRWTPETPNKTHQRMPIGNDYSMTYVVSQYVEDGSFLKVSNATLGYTIPKHITDALKIGKVRAYISADNLLTITNYSGLDPEASSTPANSDSQAGIDAFSYPLTRTIKGGIRIDF